MMILKYTYTLFSKKKVFFCACILSLGVLSTVDARIQTRVLSDGSIEYYNSYYTPPQTTYSATRSFSITYTSLINRIAKKHGIDPYLVACIIKIESDFVPHAVSHAGAQGLMQLMPATASMYDITDPFDPQQNIDAGVRHFAMLMRQTDNDIALSLAAYHAGLSRVQKRMSVPDIASTIHYVNRVMYLYTGRKDVALESRPLRRSMSSDGVIEFRN